MRRHLLVAIAIAAAVGAAGWTFARWSAAAGVVLGAASAVAFVCWALPQTGVAILDHAVLAWRTLLWRGRQGRHHEFGGVALDIADDGRHVWIGGRGLQRVLATHDSPEVLAARHAGRWRNGDDGDLLLRVDAVVERLATAPGRHDPRTQRLRRYLEREVLYPAAERRRRAVR